METTETLYIDKNQIDAILQNEVINIGETQYVRKDLSLQIMKDFAKEYRNKTIDEAIEVLKNRVAFGIIEMTLESMEEELTKLRV